MRYAPFPLMRAEFSQRMDALRFAFAKWDINVAGRPTVPPGALVLTSDEHREAVAAAETLDACLAAARRRLRREPERAVQLGVPAAVAQAAAREADADDAPIVTRIDLFLTADGWRASEANDDCPGGYNEAIGLPAVLHDVTPEGTGVAGDLPDALVGLARATRDRAAARDAGFSVDTTPLGIVYATGYAEDLQVVELLRALCGSEGIPTVAASPANVDLAGDRARLLGEPVAGFLRFFPAEWMPNLPNWATWQALLAQGTPITNSLATAWTQSKAMPLWLHSPAADGIDPGLATARRLLPATRVLDGATQAETTTQAHRFILKPVYGRMGEGLLLGAEAPPQLWGKRVRQHVRASGTNPYVVQERFYPVPVEVAPGATATACVGAYVVGGRFAGYYSRLSPGPVVRHDSANVLTVVEGL